MNTIKNAKARCFFRSFAISFIIFFCMLFLALGCFLAYAQMKNKISGENVPVADILKHSLDFLKSSSK